MSSVTVRRLLIVLTLSAASVGCPSLIEPPVDRLSEPEGVLALSEQRLKGLSSIVAEARVSYYSDDGARKGRLTLAARVPSSVYLAALTPTDDLVAAFATDGSRFMSFERGATRCVTGDACPSNMSRLLPVALESDDLVRVLLGAPPRVSSVVDNLTWDGHLGAYRVQQALGGDESQQVWIDHHTGRTRRVLRLKGDTLVYQLDYDDLTHIDGVALARELSVKMAHRNVDLKIRYRDVDLNLDINDALFQPICPDGMRVETRRCTND